MENRFGIALGGGGSRAFVHLGVLARFEEEGLRPGFVSGSSMGAVVGALYARRPGGDAIPGILDYFRKSSLFGGLVRQDKGDGLHKRPGFFGIFCRKAATASIAGTISFRLGLRRMNPVVHAIDDLFGKENVRFEDLALPFAANAINLTDGRLEEHAAGPLAPALKAGVTIGLVFAPYVWNGSQYADAAPIAPVPVTMCRNLGAEKVLAVDICAPLARPQESYSGFDVVRRIMAVQSEVLNDAEVAGADDVLRIDVSDVFWGDFSCIDELYRRGYEAAAPAVERVRAMA
ncbi:MAG: patatin-like phospholipase family protein [Planctomycetaceae bacterium]|nr:patatin-like phospholipase family protein [Planctomycetaceae bacterium]